MMGDNHGIFGLPFLLLPNLFIHRATIAQADERSKFRTKELLCYNVPVKKIPVLTLLLLALPLKTPAEPATDGAATVAVHNLAEVSDEKLQEIQELHAKAEGQIVQNDFHGAIKTYQEILLIEPDDETAYTNLGRIHMILGDTQKAAECFRNALSIDPDNEAARLGIEKIKDPDRGFVVSEEFAQNPAPAMPPAEATAQPAAPVPPTKPATAPDVFFEKQVQQALKNAGLYNGEVDGVIGNATRNAVIGFQKFHGLKPDGKVGPKTWAILQPYLNANKTRNENRAPDKN